MPTLPTSREEARARVAFALDVPDAEAAAPLLDELSDVVRLFKVGLELWTKGGQDIVRQLVASGHEVFLDLKLHDIPATVEAATRNVASLGVKFLTVHEPPSSVRGADAGRVGTKTRLLGVTFLTSMSEEEVRTVYGLEADSDIGAAVVAKGRRLLVAGCDGLVTSAREVARLRVELPEAVLVVPGIRPAGTEAGDQKRVATPGDAVRSGADYLVVGRPIRDAPDRRAVVESILDEVWEGFQTRAGAA